MKKIILIVVIVLVPSFVFASFSIKLENTFDKKMYYMLYWIDHPYKWSGPANMAGGELNSLESVEITVKFDNGQYCVIWRDTGEWRNKLRFNVETDLTQLTVNPERIVY
jgi:hypothetical protein